MAENVTGNIVLRPENRACRLLIVDDEPDICLALAGMLTQEGCYTREATSGALALELLRTDSFDVMILDMQMPGMSGMEVLAVVGQQHPDLKVIILTGHPTLDNAIAAAKSEQVVDYLQKPAKRQEVVEAVLRSVRKHNRQLRQKQLGAAARQFYETLHRSGFSTRQDPAAASLAPEPAAPSGLPENVLQVGPLSLDRRQRVVTVENRPDHPIQLTRGEAGVLTSLMARPNRVRSCREIVLAVWGYEIDEAEAASVVRPYISRMRRKIAAAGQDPQLIRTVRGSGYFFAGTEDVTG